jgi:UDP:flavonoid glycosyltransferase YjiC (YdhE family)
VPRPALSALEQFSRLAADPRIGREVGARLTALDPGAVLADCMLGSAASAARRVAPTAVLFHTFLEYWERMYARGPVGTAARLRGTDLRRAWRAAERRIVVSDAALDPAARRMPPTAEWVGPTETGTPARRPAGLPPLVVVSLSTNWLPRQTDAYQRIATALGSLRVRGLVTAGGLRPDCAIELPRNVEWADRRPHAEVFPQAALVIGHGGHSTATLALAHDLPMVVMPMSSRADQPMVAAAIERAGAGLELAPTASSDDIASAVRRVLADGSMRTRAAAIGARLRAADGARGAADTLLQLAATTARQR